jgi:hypothetical protein
MFKISLLLCAILCAVVCIATSNKGTSQDAWQDTEFTTNLWSIISSGNTEELRSILETGPDVSRARSSDGRGPLWWAYEYKREEMVQMLLDAGASPTERDADGKTPDQVKNVGPTDFMKERGHDSGFADDVDSPAKNYHGEEMEDDF